MIPRLFAFDLDGTLLDSTKKLSNANLEALREIQESGAVIVFASGRLGSSMCRYCSEDLEISMLTLNGAAVYMGKDLSSQLIFEAPLDAKYANYLLSYAQNQKFALNYYINDKLYTIKNLKNRSWIDLYYQQTSTEYVFLDTFDQFSDCTPSKILFVGDSSEIDKQEAYFRSLWKDSIYICRTWDHYLEFLNPLANKGTGLKKLAQAHGLDLSQTIAFGDAENDIPMLETAGMGIAVGNALNKVKAVASKVSSWSNDEDAIAREWSLIKKEYMHF
jgi:Cof subfamily protein (haloacid dehalogenase superfamily)